jgi:hypothetical protein
VEASQIAVWGLSALPALVMVDREGHLIQQTQPDGPAGYTRGPLGHGHVVNNVYQLTGYRLEIIPRW